MTNELCVVDIKFFHIYDFANSKEQAEETLLKAKKSKEKDVKTWENHCQNYPDVEQFKVYLEQAKNKEYQIMTYEEFLQMEREHYINSPMTKITEEKFMEMLNVLPPMKWCTIQGIEMFCISEMLTGTYTSQYLHDKRSNEFYHKIVDVRDKETWGYNFI